MTTKTTASTTAPANAPTTAAKNPTQKPAQPTKAAGAAKATQTVQKAAQPTKASTTKPDATKTSVTAVRFYRLRKTGTARHLPVLDAGSEERKAAETIAQRLANGETVAAISEDTGLSVSTVRRQAATLDFTQRVEAGEFTALVKKAKDGQVVFPASTKDEK